MIANGEPKTFPLPLDSPAEVVRALSGLFPMSELKRVSQGLAAVVSVYCELDHPFQISSPAPSPSADPPPAKSRKPYKPRVKVTDELRKQVLLFRSRNEPWGDIARVTGLSHATLNAIVNKANRADASK